MPWKRSDYSVVLRLVLVGESGVGKTALVQRFVSGAFRAAAAATVGVDFSVGFVRRGGRVIRLDIWDTAGSESYRSIPPNYFRKAEAVVLVYDSTDLASFRLLPHWFVLAHRYAPAHRTKIFIVGTKYDAKSSCAVSDEQVNLYADTLQLPNFKTSARDGAGVRECFEKMVDIMLEHKSTLGSNDASVTLRRGTGLPPPRVGGCCGRAIEYPFRDAALRPPRNATEHPAELASEIATQENESVLNYSDPQPGPSGMQQALATMDFPIANVTHGYNSDFSSSEETHIYENVLDYSDPQPVPSRSQPIHTDLPTEESPTYCNVPYYSNLKPGPSGLQQMRATNQELSSSDETRTYENVPINRNPQKGAGGVQLMHTTVDFSSSSETRVYENVRQSKIPRPDQSAVIRAKTNPNSSLYKTCAYERSQTYTNLRPDASGVPQVRATGMSSSSSESRATSADAASSDATRGSPVELSSDGTRRTTPEFSSSEATRATPPELSSSDETREPAPYDSSSDDEELIRMLHQ